MGKYPWTALTGASTPVVHEDSASKRKLFKARWVRLPLPAPRISSFSNTRHQRCHTRRQQATKQIPLFVNQKHLTVSDPTRAVGNDHFCDTTERASQRLFSSYKGGIPLYHRSGEKPLDPHKNCARIQSPACPNRSKEWNPIIQRSRSSARTSIARKTTFTS